MWFVPDVIGDHRGGILKVLDSEDGVVIDQTHDLWVGVGEPRLSAQTVNSRRELVRPFCRSVVWKQPAPENRGHDAQAQAFGGLQNEIGLGKVRLGISKRQLKGRADRKSTRLNSSHANISYAVF